MKINQITRTEIFFTATLYHVAKANPKSMELLLKDKLCLPDGVRIVDSGFEVCFFRDFAKKDLIKRRGKSQEKQTFDNLFVLSNGSIVVIEAKAQQKFNEKQINNLVDSKKEIEASRLCSFEKAYIVGLHSSKYSPKQSTLKPLDATITWKEVADYLSDFEGIFSRADSIYGQ